MADIPNLLRENGLQITAQRLAVMRVVTAHPHCTADEVAKFVRDELGAISRQAVYDVLGILVDKRLLRRIQPAGSAARYEDRVHDQHHHVICRQCGKTSDVNCMLKNADLSRVAAGSGFKIEEAEVIFWGICPECAGTST